MSEAFLDEEQSIHFELPIPVRVWGKIVRIKKEGVRTQYAVRFEKVSLVDRLFLKRFLRRAQQNFGQK